MLRAVDVRTKSHTLVGDPSQPLQAKNLKAAAIGEDRALPAHELVQAAESRDQVGSRAYVQVIRVAQYHGGVQLYELAGRETLDGRLGAHGAKRWGGNVTVGRVDNPHASEGSSVLVQEVKGHRPC